MNSSCAKAALAPLVLAATWATAHADDTLTTTLTPSASVGTVDHLRIFAEDYTPGTITGSPFPGSSFPFIMVPGSYVPDSAVVSQDFGPVTNPSTVTGQMNVTYAAGTSAYVGLVGTAGTDQLIFSSNGYNETNATSYFASGTNFTDTFDAIVNGNAATLLSLFGNPSAGNSASGLSLYDLTSGFASTIAANRFYVLSRQTNGSVTSMAYNDPLTLSLSPVAKPVPEPASIAALGAGALTLLRRRRKLA